MKLDTDGNGCLVVTPDGVDGCVEVRLKDGRMLVYVEADGSLSCDVLPGCTDPVDGERRS